MKHYRENLHTLLESNWEALRAELKEETMDTVSEVEQIADEIETNRIHADNLRLLAEALYCRECHSCGEYHSHVVDMFNPDDPEARGEYCPDCSVQKRMQGWRVET